jgi:tetratricopeptide (TPR) repeat protein
MRVQYCAFLILASIVLAAEARAENANAPGRRDFEQGRKLMKAKQYDQALPHFERAYELSHHRPATALALAQCERMVGRVEDALRHYREYVAGDPKGAEVPRIQELIQKLEAQASKSEAPQAADARARSPDGSDSMVTPPIAPEAQARVADKPRGMVPEAPPPQPAATTLGTVPPAPTSASPLVTSPPPAVKESSSSSAWIWIVSGVAVVGGGVALAVVLATHSGHDPYGGTSNIVARP